MINDPPDPKATPPENTNPAESNQDQKKEHPDKAECPKATNSKSKQSPGTGVNDVPGLDIRSGDRI